MIKIFTEKINGENGSKMYMVTGFENVYKKEDLPDEYLGADPCYYLYSDCIKLYPVHSSELDISKNDIFYKEEWENTIIPAMKKAGERLIKINNWTGKTTFTI